MTDEERNDLADRLNNVWAVLRHIRASDLPAPYDHQFDGSYADTVLEAAAEIRPTPPDQRRANYGYVDHDRCSSIVA